MIILLIEFVSFGLVRGGGLVRAPLIMSTTQPGSPSLTDAVTTPLCQNAVARVDQNNRFFPPP